MISRSLAMLGLMAPLSVAAPQGSASWPDSNRLGRAGWYEPAPGHKVLVTWAPTGKELRLLDFDSAHFHRLVPGHDSAFVWRRGADSVNRVVRFLRLANGEISGFAWRGAGSDSGFLPRATEFPFDQEKARFRNDSIELAGTLLIPRVRRFVGTPGAMRETPITVPGAVIIHGSGSSDRDNVWAFHIAQRLARDGIAVLIPDKRGSGASGGDWRAVDFGDLADDARAAARVLAAHPKVDPDRVGYVGLSQGGWIAPLAASREARTAFVVNISGSAVTPGRQVRHEIAQDLRRAQIPDTSISNVLGLFDRAMDYARSFGETDWDRYLRERDRLSRGSLADAVAPFPAARDHWQWRWWNGVVDFDPVPLWRDLKTPSLVIYGELDEQDNVPVEASVERLRPALRPERAPGNAIRVFPGLGHALVDTGTGWVSEAFLEFLSRWIRLVPADDS